MFAGSSPKLFTILLLGCSGVVSAHDPVDEIATLQTNMKNEKDESTDCGYTGDLQAACQNCSSDATGVFVCPSFSSFRFKGAGTIFYAEVPLGGSDVAADYLGLYHSGIVGIMDDGSNWTLQFYATEGFANAVKPTFADGKLTYKNGAKIVFSNSINESYWTQNHTLATNVSELVLNKLLDFTVEYASSHKSYELFSVRQYDNNLTVLKEDQICDSFTRDFALKLASLGVTMLTTNVRYNIAIVFGKNVTNTTLDDNYYAVAEFYSNLSSLLNFSAISMNFSAVSSAAKFHDFHNFFSPGYVFVGSPASGIAKVETDFPYFWTTPLQIEIVANKTSEQSMTDALSKWMVVMRPVFDAMKTCLQKSNEGCLQKALKDALAAAAAAAE